MDFLETGRTRHTLVALFCDHSSVGLGLTKACGNGTLVDMAHVLRSVFLALGLFAGVALAASPLIAAYRLHEAIERGDVPTIEEAVDWPSVRHSLKSSVSQVMIADAEARRSELGMFRRIGYKIGDAFAPYFVDRMIAKQMTPQGFIDYARQPTAAGSRPPRVVDLIERAAYTSLDRFEIDVRDRIDRSRRYRAVFTRKLLTWTMTEVRLLPPRRTARLLTASAP